MVVVVVVVVGASGFDGHARRRSPSPPPLLVDHRYLGRYREADLDISILSCVKYIHGIVSFVHLCFWVWDVVLTRAVVQQEWQFRSYHSCVQESNSLYLSIRFWEVLFID